MSSNSHTNFSYHWITKATCWAHASAIYLYISPHLLYIGCAQLRVIAHSRASPTTNNTHPLHATDTVLSPARLQGAGQDHLRVSPHSIRHDSQQRDALSDQRRFDIVSMVPWPSSGPAAAQEATVWRCRDVQGAGGLLRDANG